MENENQTSETITFLGTGGARFMIITQILASGGLWLNIGGTQILVDPGPGCIVQATRRKFRPENLSAIILSHRHLDHSADIAETFDDRIARMFLPRSQGMRSSRQPDTPRLAVA